MVRYHNSGTQKFDDVESDSVNTEKAAVGPDGDKRPFGDRIDLFVVGGQSNSFGKGDGSNSPTPESDNLLKYDASEDSLKKLEDPIAPETSTGSAWPAFGIRYRELTGVPVCIAIASGGGPFTRVDGTNDPNWWDDSSHPKTLLNNTVNAYQKLREAGYAVNFRGVLWAQGERDAQEIDRGNITKQDYLDAWRSDANTFEDSFLTVLDSETREPFGSQEFKVFIHETAAETDAGVGDSTGFTQIRQAQREIADIEERVAYASGIQRSFVERGLMSDDIHYNQQGYNEMGRHSAERIAGGRVRPRTDVEDITVRSEIPADVQSHDTNNKERVLYNDTQDRFGQFEGTANEFTAEWSGEYRVTVRIAWNNTIPDGMLSRLHVYRNGTPTGSGTRDLRLFETAGASKFHTVTGGRTLELSSGDTLGVWAEKDASGSHDILGNSWDSHWEIEYLGQPG